MSDSRLPPGMLNDPGDAPADDALTDFANSLRASIRLAAKRSEVVLNQKPLIDAERKANGDVFVRVAVFADFVIDKDDAENISDGINAVACPMAHLWSLVK